VARPPARRRFFKYPSGLFCHIDTLTEIQILSVAQPGGDDE